MYVILCVNFFKAHWYWLLLYNVWLSLLCVALVSCSGHRWADEWRCHVWTGKGSTWCPGAGLETVHATRNCSVPFVCLILTGACGSQRTGRGDYSAGRWSCNYPGVRGDLYPYVVHLSSLCHPYIACPFTILVRVSPSHIMYVDTPILTHAHGDLCHSCAVFTRTSCLIIMNNLLLWERYVVLVDSVECRVLNSATSSWSNCWRSCTSNRKASFCRARTGWVCKSFILGRDHHPSSCNHVMWLFSGLIISNCWHYLNTINCSVVEERGMLAKKTTMWTRSPAKLQPRNPSKSASFLKVERFQSASELVPFSAEELPEHQHPLEGNRPRQQLRPSAFFPPKIDMLVNSTYCNCPSNSSHR